MLEKLWDFMFGKSIPDAVVVEEKVEEPVVSVLPQNEDTPVVVHLKKHKIDLFKDAKGEWRWNIRAGNNKLIASSSESYKNRKDAVANVNSVTSLNADLR